MNYELLLDMKTRVETNYNCAFASFTNVDFFIIDLKIIYPFALYHCVSLIYVSWRLFYLRLSALASERGVRLVLLFHVDMYWRGILLQLFGLTKYMSDHQVMSINGCCSQWYGEIRHTLICYLCGKLVIFFTE